jgi:hypothetical protein
MEHCPVPRRAGNQVSSEPASRSASSVKREARRRSGPIGPGIGVHFVAGVSCIWIGYELCQQRCQRKVWSRLDLGFGFTMWQVFSLKKPTKQPTLCEKGLFETRSYKERRHVDHASPSSCLALWSHRRRAVERVSD